MNQVIRSSTWLTSCCLFALALPGQDDGKSGTGLKVNTDAPGPRTANAATNITLVRNWRRTSGGYNDIWGWTAPDGREFAYVGERSGIWFVETTTPSNIKQIGWWSAPRSTWRDFTNYGSYVYAVSEGHSGIRIFDMSNPSSPRDLGTVATSQIRNTHNISVDPATGHLYLSGTNQGLAIFNAKANPTNPTFVGSWRTSYTHDCCIRRGKAYLSNGRSYVCRIMDTTNPASLREIGRANTPGGYDHNVWVSEDDQVMAVTDEISRGSSTPHLTLWDISNPARPVKRGDYDLRGIVHNVFIVGRAAYMSHYYHGFHMVDIGNLSSPKMVAEYDTSSSTSGYNGAWGCYPFSDSGLVYVSDISNGLYVFRITAGHMNRYDAGTQGSNGTVPKMKFDGATPRVGASGLKVRISRMKPNAQGALLVAAGKGNFKLLGVQINVDLATLQMVRFKADASGRAVLSTPVSNNAGLGGARIYMQIVAEDTGNSNGFSSSRGMWAGIAK
ncbi:MAG: choice-of-anchor B family protein [Planctomycetota bacterium]|nr:choice-of-anchor B family protein [Planctomycetota bacterium]